jgi:puromycin-sensitive aminopeptidase
MTTSRADNPYRLPTNVEPTHYDLELTPNIDAATFTGHVAITLDVHETVDQLQLNAVELEFTSITLTDATGATQSLTATFDEKFERATVALRSPLAVGRASLAVAFTGILNDQLVGFYKSTYVDTDGVTQALATTQFEATEARRAFPCWDEPPFKATFDVTLNVPAHLSAYSNSPVQSESYNADGSRRVSFSTTMKMSTYLVAAIVGPFEETDPVDVLGTPVRVIYPKGKGHLAQFSLEAAEHALRYFTEYFGIPYPGDKLDHIAVPDFAFGAMENLGLVTYRETALLIDPASASLAELERIADVVSHETAHMWFGDLVTMAWWEGIWLNEAFATFMETKCVEHFRPSWNKWLSFMIFRDMAMQIDGLHSTRPIEFEVVAPVEMRGMFDLLTYEKGCSVLRMLEQYLGEETFRDGIRRYLTTHAYGNTVTTDLWDALEAVSSEPVRDLMNTFILQGGHPLITFENGELTQEPFAYGAPSGQPTAIGSSWIVPVGTRPLSGGDVTKHLLTSSSSPLSASVPLVVNAGGWGVFRTRYGSAELAPIAANLGQLDPIERCVLVADAWAALFASRITWSDFLALARGLGSEDEPSTWSNVAQAFDFVSRAATDAQRTALEVTVREVFQPQFDRLGWTPIDGEPELAAQMRAIAVGSLGTLGNVEGIQAESRRLFEQNELDGDIARSVLRVVASEGRREDFDRFLERWRTAPNPQEEQRYQFGLADFPGEQEALDAAEKCFGEFRTQDGPIVLSILERNRITGPAVWRYVTSRWDEAMTRFTPTLHTRMFGGIITFFPDEKIAAEVEAFHLSHPITGEDKTIAQMLERLRVGVTFADAVRRQL